MASVLLRWLTTSAAVLMVPHVVSGVHLDGVAAALASAAILGALNTVARPVLVFLTFPLTVLSFGLFLWIINAALLELAAALVPGFRIDSFGSAMLASVWISALSWLLSLPSRRPRVTVFRPPPGKPRRDGRTIDLEQDEQGKWE